jgi:thiol:disulfide interchange protein DsbD
MLLHGDRARINRLSGQLALLLILGVACDAQAQVACSLSTEKDGETVFPISKGTNFTAKLMVKIMPGWHISSLTTPDGGPMRTEIKLLSNQPAKLSGPIDAPPPNREHSEIFAVDVEWYTGSITFAIPLQATAPVLADTKLGVEISYQACTEKICLLPRTEKVEAVLKPKGTLGTGDIVMQGYPASDYDRIKVRLGTTVPDFAYQDLDGNPHRLAEFRGKYVLLDFWGIW